MFKISTVFIGVLLLVLSCMPLFSFAACGPLPLPPCSPLGTIDQATEAGMISTDAGGEKTTIDLNGLIRTISVLINWFSWFIGVIAVVMGLYSGLLFITGRDNAQQLVTARKTMMWAIIGIAVAIITFSIIALTKAIIGF